MFVRDNDHVMVTKILGVKTALYLYMYESRIYLPRH